MLLFAAPARFCMQSHSMMPTLPAAWTGIEGLRDYRFPWQG
jgi:hypothetical protein